MRTAIRKAREVAHDRPTSLENASAQGVGLEMLEYEHMYCAAFQES